MSETDALREEYRTLLNETLPARIQSPIRFNHCFARVVLDWLFADVWYGHVAKPAYRHLTDDQLRRCIARMRLWLTDRAVLESDNARSLALRRGRKRAAG